MTREALELLERYARQPVEVRRIALNIGQVAQYGPPPNFAKEEDPRCAAYVQQSGEHCWELDASPPDLLDRLARDAIVELIDAKRCSDLLSSYHSGAGRERRGRSFFIKGGQRPQPHRCLGAVAPRRAL